MVAATHYLDLIDQGVSAWNHWRSEHPDECPDLGSAYLFEKSLRGINFSHINLSRACLIGSDLHGADLSGANLSGAYANNTNFASATLTAADLRGGNFIEANFSEADVSNAVTDGADFTNAIWLEVLPAGDTVDMGDTGDTGDTSDTDDVVDTVVWPARVLRSQAIPILPRPDIAQPRWQWGVGMATVAMAILSSYLVIRAQSPRFVAADGTVKLQLVCDQADPVVVTGAAPDHTYQDGTEFYGQFVAGQPANGRGSMFYPNGNRYDGHYHNGRRHGCGAFSFKNGRRYVGEFSDDLFSGRGMWMLENGDRYVGDFAYNKCDGEGVYLFSNGTVKSGLWQQGQLVDGTLTCDRNPTERPNSP